MAGSDCGLWLVSCICVGAKGFRTNRRAIFDPSRLIGSPRAFTLPNLGAQGRDGTLESVCVCGGKRRGAYVAGPAQHGSWTCCGRAGGAAVFARPEDRKSVVWGKRCSVRVDSGCTRKLKKKKYTKHTQE